MLLANIVMAIAAVAAVVVACIAWLAAEHIGRVQIFLELRKSYVEIAARLDPRYHDDEWISDPDSAARRGLEAYWLHVVTEWYSTTKLNRGKHRDLWHDFYTKAVQGGLRNKSLRTALCEMASSFSGYRAEFLREIYRLTPEAHREELRNSTAFRDVSHGSDIVLAQKPTERRKSNVSDERFVRWQANTIGQFSATLSLLSGLALAGVGFLFSLLAREEFTPGGIYAVLFLTALTAFFLASLAGIAAFVTRLLDFRLTAREVRNGATEEPLTIFGTDASSYGKATWRLFWLVLAAMAVAVVCAVVVMARIYLNSLISAI